MVGWCWVVFIASTRGLPLNTQNKDRVSCLFQVFFFFSDLYITLQVLDAQQMQGRYVSCEAEGTCSPVMRTLVSSAQSQPRPSQPLQTFRPRDARGPRPPAHVCSLGAGMPACPSFTPSPSLPLVPFFFPAFSSFHVSLCQTLCQVRRIKGSIKPRLGLTSGLGNPQRQPFGHGSGMLIIELQ